LVANKSTHTRIDLDVNYRYFVSYGVARRERRSFSVLDFGCATAWLCGHSDGGVSIAHERLFRRLAFIAVEMRKRPTYE
jgi:hypothetical protein